MSTEEVVEALKQQLERVSVQLAQKDPIDEEIEALTKRLQELRAAQAEASGARFALQRDRASLKIKLRDAEAKAEQERENIRQREALKESYERFDAITQDKKWRVGVPNQDGEIQKILAHQLSAAHFLASAKRAVLADDMGLGKTIEVCAGSDMAELERILIITPGEVMSGFKAEMQRWTDRSVAVIGRVSKASAFMQLGVFADVKGKIAIIINYEAWRRSNELIERLKFVQFDAVILDEAHRIKETSTNAYRGVEELVLGNNTCSLCKGRIVKNLCVNPNCLNRDKTLMEPSVKYFYALTGTPILNRPAELYPHLHLIAPERFYSQRSFLRNYCDQYGNDWVFRPGGASLLARDLESIYLRRTLADTDVVLPPQDIIIHELDLDPEEYPKQSSILKTLHENAQILIDDGDAVEMPSILALITRQRQATVWPGGIKIKRRILDFAGMPVIDPLTDKPVFEVLHVGEEFQESIKIDETVMLVQEFVEGGHRASVFSQFTEPLLELQRRLEKAGLRVALYTGATPHAKRDEIKLNFDRKYGEEAKWDVVLVQFRTGGEGLNITAATQMIILDEEWNPGKNDQAYARIRRIGQTEKTTVHVLRVMHRYSKDMWMADLIADKRKTVTEFNQSNDAIRSLKDLMTREWE